MKTRFIFLLSSMVLCSCRIEPGAMLGGEQGSPVDCSRLNVVYNGGSVEEWSSIDELRSAMFMYQSNGRLQVSFRPRTLGHGVWKLDSLVYQRVREDSPTYDVVTRKAICKEARYDESGSQYDCVLEKRNNALDGKTFYFQTLNLKAGNYSYHFSATGPAEGCPMQGPQKQISDVYLVNIPMPSFIPDEMPPLSEDYE